MKVTLVCAIIFAAVAVSYAALTCMGDAEKCTPEECCVQLGPVGTCRPLLKEDDVCEMKPLKHLFKDHVYKIRCPCGPGLKCVSSKGGIVGKFAGKCHPDSGEEGGEE